MRHISTKRFLTILIFGIFFVSLKAEAELTNNKDQKTPQEGQIHETVDNTPVPENKNNLDIQKNDDSGKNEISTGSFPTGENTSNDDAKKEVVTALSRKESESSPANEHTSPIAPPNVSGNNNLPNSNPPITNTKLESSTNSTNQDNKKEEKPEIPIATNSQDEKSESPNKNKKSTRTPNMTAQATHKKKSKKHKTKPQTEKKEMNPIKEMLEEINEMSHDFKEFNKQSNNNDTKQLKEIEDSIFDEGSDFEDDEIISDYSSISLGKVYELSDIWKTVDLPSLDDAATTAKDTANSLSSYLVLTIKGYGHLSVKLHSKSHIKHENIQMDSTYEMSYLPIDRHKYLSEGSPKLEIRIENGMMSMLETPRVKFEFKDSLEMEFNQNHRVYTNFAHEIRYKVTHPEKHLNDEGKEDRLQFILQSTLNEQASRGNEDLSMYINKKKKFPGRSNYELRATGNLGYGLIKTLGPKSNSYCIESGCEFYVTIFSHNIDALFFFPTVFANGSKLSFHRSFFLLEEVEGLEQVTYELDVPYHSGDWVFSIQPMEGSPNMMINPDKEAENLGQAMYKTVGGGAEEITITSKEASMFGFSFKKFFVTFIGSGIKNDVATFKFNVLRMTSDQIKNIKLNYAETGVVANREISHYKLQFLVEEPEFIDFRLKMKTLNGSGMLVIKECESGKHCLVQKSDIERCKQHGLGPTAVPGEGIDYENSYNDSTAMTGDNPFEPDNRRVLLAENGRMLQANGNQYNPYWNPANSSETQIPMPNTQYQPYQPQIGQMGSTNQGLYTPQVNQYTPQNNLQNQPSMIVGQDRLSYPPQTQVNNYQYNPNTRYQYQNQQYQPYDPTLGNQITAPYQNPEMLTRNDLQKTDIQKTNMENNQQALLIPPQNQTTTGGGSKIPEQLIQRDNHNNLIKPGQDLLTSSSSEEMMDKISDPLLNLVVHEGVMNEKDKELKNIQDYSLLKQQPLPNQNSKPETDQNPDVQIQNQESAVSDDELHQELFSAPSQTLQEPPKEFKYDLKEEINTNYLKCVQGNTEDNVQQEHSIIMKFNCLGQFNSNKGETFEQLDDEFPYSQSCSFAVGVYGNNKNDDLGGTYYSLIGSGGKTHKMVKFRTSSEFIIQENEVRFFRFDLRDYIPAVQAKIRMKVVAITGSCKVN